MVKADMGRRVLSRPVFHGEQEYAIVSEMILGGTYSKSRVDIGTPILPPTSLDLLG